MARAIGERIFMKSRGKEEKGLSHVYIESMVVVQLQQLEYHLLSRKCKAFKMAEMSWR